MNCKAKKEDIKEDRIMRGLLIFYGCVIGGNMDWNRNSLGVRIVGQVREIMKELADFLPMTLRQIHYQLVARNVDGSEPIQLFAIRPRAEIDHQFVIKNLLLLIVLQVVERELVDGEVPVHVLTN